MKRENKLIEMLVQMDEQLILVKRWITLESLSENSSLGCGVTLFQFSYIPKNLLSGSRDGNLFKQFIQYFAH